LNPGTSTEREKEQKLFLCILSVGVAQLAEQSISDCRFKVSNSASDGIEKNWCSVILKQICLSIVKNLSTSNFTLKMKIKLLFRVFVEALGNIIAQ
jgi:hypothetical protein